MWSRVELLNRRLLQYIVHGSANKYFAWQFTVYAGRLSLLCTWCDILPWNFFPFFLEMMKDKFCFLLLLFIYLDVFFSSLTLFPGTKCTNNKQTISYNSKLNLHGHTMGFCGVAHIHIHMCVIFFKLLLGIW